jgi:endonuclease I
LLKKNFSDNLLGIFAIDDSREIPACFTIGTMKNRAIALSAIMVGILLLPSMLAVSQIPPAYYNAAGGLSGDDLKTALHNIIDDHTSLSYSAVTEALKMTDEDTLDSNNVICLYTGWSYPKSSFGNGSEDWNREHVWAKAHGDFGETPPEGTDLHHLRPADASVNSAKQDRDFSKGIVEYLDPSGPTGCFIDTDIWEPRPEVKGDVARMIFYMAVRYEGDAGELDLEMVNYVNSAPNNEPFYGLRDTLIAWHGQDPVNDWERNRNDIISYSYQGNRNPFIDHPEYVDLIWGDATPVETFDVAGYWAGGTMGSYNAKTYTNPSGPENDQFSSNQAVREDQYVSSGSYAWRIDDQANSYLRYECEEYVEGFDVRMARWDNSPKPFVTIRYSTNSGTTWTVIETIDGDYFSADKSYQLYSHTFPEPDSADAGEKLYIEFLTTAGERMLYDDFTLYTTVPLEDEPANHVTGFTASTGGAGQISVSWTDSDADNYLIKGSSSGFGAIPDPVDGESEFNSTFVYNAAAGEESHEFTGLNPNVSYYFKIFPYNGTGKAVNYKTDGSIPQDTAITESIRLIISEVTDPGDVFAAKYVEVHNLSNFYLDFSNIPIYLCRQANASGWETELLTGTIPGNGTMTVAYNTTFDSQYGEPSSRYNGAVVTGNGNDGYFLFLDGDHTSGTLLDAYGEIDVSGYGEAWEYTDRHAVRKRTVESPSATWLADEWVILPADVKDMTPLMHAADITWQGATYNWNAKGANWNSRNGCIPDASCNVTVPATANDPIITENSACNSIYLQSGTVLDVQSTVTLQICGNSDN